MTLLDLLTRRRRRPLVQQASTSPTAVAWQRFRRNPTAIAGLCIIGLFSVVALLGYLITPDHTPHCNQQYLELSGLRPLSSATFVYIDDGHDHPRHNALHRMLFGEPLPYLAIPIFRHTDLGDSLEVETYTGAVPNDGERLRFAQSDVRGIDTRTFLFGTDGYGRDVLSQMMIGSRVSLSVGFIAVAIALLVGLLLGSLAAYYGGWVDNLIVWFINVVWSIPTVLLVIAITFALGKGFWQVFVAVGLTMWVDVARVVRGQVMSLKEKEFAEAARALGFRTPRILLRHLLPNTLGAVIVITASNFASAILLEAGLSFLGIGVQPPTPSWGSMVKENYSYILLDNAYLALIPGIAIMLIVLAFMLVGSGIRDSLDIKQQ
ncbi:MAG: ABC transporter permease [Bacteroidales bacterium]|nr:ABC transporter permease [Bacteroidales bacterium]